MKLTELAQLTEGGEATSSSGSGRIKREDIPATIKYVSDLLAIPRNELHALGSVGKIADSGDIDLAVDMNKYNPDHIDKVMKAHGFHGSYNKGTRVASYAVPVKGDQSKGKVQVDFMYTPNTEWAKFSYFSPGEGSRYKGAIRTILLSSVAAVLNEPGTDHFEYLDSGELSVRVGRSIDLPSGLRRIYQYRPKKAKGDGYTKSMKSLSPEDFKRMHPEVQVKNGQMLIDDPEKVVKALFGKGVAPDDVQSAEQILHLIKTKFTHEQQAKIFKIAAARMSSMKGKVRLPAEVEELLGK